jgi:putative SOS response-associated peptidase YedK
MCGRYAYYKEHPELRARARKEIDEHGLVGDLFTPRWNVSPTQLAPVARAIGGELVVDQLRWGLMPSWSKDRTIGARCINARVDTAATKPAFRAAWKARRCLVPASGFYEWTAEKPKRVWYFQGAGGAPLAFAGLWETWTDKGTGEVLDTFTVLTREPYAVVRPVHDRSPLALPSNLWTPWLAGEIKDAAAIAAVDVDLEAWRVGAAVGSPRNEGPQLVEPLPA